MGFKHLCLTLWKRSLARAVNFLHRCSTNKGEPTGLLGDVLTPENHFSSLLGNDKLAKYVGYLYIGKEPLNQNQDKMVNNKDYSCTGGLSQASAMLFDSVDGIFRSSVLEQEQ
ncbi:uncharacterized protein LOC107303536 [Oryza brachyantha]|uniref:uncharacterized protein LOC107303536 n=1 Tax=Oryza brachyantha TaxID=4533 RepID=UPI000776689F|nr:uncharacterized protein LOC107303536 [Oryza brachyantha]